MTWLFDWLLRLHKTSDQESQFHHDDDDEDEDDDEEEEWERSGG